MIRLFRYILACSISCGIAATVASCSEDELDGTSIFDNQNANAQAKARTTFDIWLDKNYVAQYNIELKYRLEDAETDYKYNLIPADLTKVNLISHAILHGWLRAYDEVAGQDFTRRYVPKVIQLIGSYPYSTSGSQKLGTAEDGMKVTFYNINDFKATSDRLMYYFQIMHHEFTHILTHNKDYDVAFRTISDTAYVTGEWKKKTATEALQKGFINEYAMSEYNEDFAETLSFYLTLTPAEWASRLATADKTDEHGVAHHGSAVIQKKLDIVRSYMLSAWGIDIDVLRDVVQRRANEIVSGSVDLEGV